MSEMQSVELYDACNKVEECIDYVPCAEKDKQKFQVTCEKNQGGANKNFTVCLPPQIPDKKGPCIHYGRKGVVKDGKSNRPVCASDNDCCPGATCKTFAGNTDFGILGNSHCEPFSDHKARKQDALEKSLCIQVVESSVFIPQPSTSILTS